MKPDAMTWEQYANALESDCHLFEKKIAQLEAERDTLARIVHHILLATNKDEAWAYIITHHDEMIKATRKEIEGE